MFSHAEIRVYHWKDARILASLPKLGVDTFGGRMISPHFSDDLTTGQKSFDLTWQMELSDKQWTAIEPIFPSSACRGQV